MSTLEEQIEPLLGALRIVPPDQYRWYGRRPDTSVSTAMRRAEAATLRLTLVAFVEALLYRQFYLSSGVTPEPPATDYLPVANESSFVRSLTAANAGTGCWESGWTVVEHHHDGMLAQRDGLTVWIAPERYGIEPQTIPSAGTSVDVRMPKELTTQLPGFYLAQSDEPFGPAPDDVLVRIYWHVTPAGAIKLMNSITSRLNAERVPFQFKMLNDPNVYYRADSAVLYVCKRDLPRAPHLLKQVYEDVRDELQPGEPALTMRLASGVALAEDPRNGESFGLHRCRLLAEAFIEAAEQGVTDSAGKLRVVEERFEREGLDLSLPYLNPGSDDDYDALLNISAWHLSIDSDSSSAEDIPSKFPISDETELRVRHLKTATEIGDRLVEGAFWYDGRCTWLGKLESQMDPHDPNRIATFGAIGPDVYTGTAGIALFLADLYTETGDERYAAAARAAINQAIHTIDQRQGRGRWGFYTGWPGGAVCVARIGRLLGDHSLAKDTPADIVDRLVASDPTKEPDLLSGTAGTIVALLALSQMTGIERFLADAVRLGDHLLSTARRRGTSMWWSVQTQAGRRGLTGFAHGAAGIAFALLELFSVTREERFGDAAEAAFAFERRNFHPEFQNWLDLRYPVEGSRFGPAALVSSVWCHGSAGIAISRLTAWKVLGDQIYLDEAETAIRATSAWVESRLALHEKPWSLCHGLPGNADILLWAAESLPEQSTTLKRLVRHVADAGIAALTTSNESGEPLSAEEPGLMLGLAGLGHFYLRLANPKIPSVLIPNAAAFDPQPKA